MFALVSCSSTATSTEPAPSSDETVAPPVETTATTAQVSAPSVPPTFSRQDRIDAVEFGEMRLSALEGLREQDLLEWARASGYTEVFNVELTPPGPDMLSYDSLGYELDDEGVVVRATAG